MTSLKRKKGANASGAGSSRPTAHSAEAPSIRTSRISIKSEIENETRPISQGSLAYFQDRLRTRLYDLVIGELESYKASGKTQAQLAARIGKRADQVSRWLAGPGNWTLDTVSDLLVGLSGAELKMLLDYPTKDSPRNFRRPEWLNSPGAQSMTRRPPHEGVTISSVVRPVVDNIGGTATFIIPANIPTSVASSELVL